MEVEEEIDCGLLFGVDVRHLEGLGEGYMYTLLSFDGPLFVFQFEVLQSVLETAVGS